MSLPSAWGSTGAAGETNDTVDRSEDEDNFTRGLRVFLSRLWPLPEGWIHHQNAPPFTPSPCAFLNNQYPSQWTAMIYFCFLNCTYRCHVQNCILMFFFFFFLIKCLCQLESLAFFYSSTLERKHYILLEWAVSRKLLKQPLPVFRDSPGCFCEVCRFSYGCHFGLL